MECIHEPTRWLLPYLLGFSSLLGLGLALYAWQYRSIPGVGYLALAKLATALWSGLYLFELLAPNLETGVWLESLKACAVHLLACAYVPAAFGYVGRPLARVTLLALAGLFVLMCGLSLGNPSQHWLFDNPRLNNHCQYPGFFFDPHAAYYAAYSIAGLLVLLAASVMLAQSASVSSLYRAQLQMLAYSILLPTLMAIATVPAIDLHPFDWLWTSVDSSALSLILSHLIFLWGVWRYQMLRSTPLGWGGVVDTSDDYILTITPQMKIAEANAKAKQALGRAIIGKPLAEVIPGASVESGQNLALGRQTLHLKTSEIAGPGGVAGWLLILRDVSELKSLEDQLYQESIRDHLTGLYNRRYFSTEVPNLLASSSINLDKRSPPNLDKRSHSNLSLILLDVDNFRQFNQRYGHSGGDAVLVAVASLLRKYAIEDLVFRQGGEEFCLLLPGVGLTKARAIADAMRAELEGLKVNFEGQTLSVTASFGVAALLQHGEVLKSADQALQQAKELGRNQVRVGLEAQTWRRGWV